MISTRFAGVAVVTLAVAISLAVFLSPGADPAILGQPRMWSALATGTALAFGMLGLIWIMYGSRRANIALAGAAVAVLAISTGLVGEAPQWQGRAMVPTDYADPERLGGHARPVVSEADQELARLQMQELGQMKQLISDLHREYVSSLSETEADDALEYHPASLYVDDTRTY